MKHFGDAKGEKKQVVENCEWACKPNVELEMPKELTSGKKIDAVH